MKQAILVKVGPICRDAQAHVHGHRSRCSSQLAGVHYSADACPRELPRAVCVWKSPLRLTHPSFLAHPSSEQTCSGALKLPVFASSMHCKLTSSLAQPKSPQPACQGSFLSIHLACLSLTFQPQFMFHRSVALVFLWTWLRTFCICHKVDPSHNKQNPFWCSSPSIAPASESVFPSLQRAAASALSTHTVGSRGFI